jgi:eukaryotic-like serine/threonine-protein kinase
MKHLVSPKGTLLGQPRRSGTLGYGSRPPDSSDAVTLAAPSAAFATTMPDASRTQARATVLPKLVLAEGSSAPTLEPTSGPRYREHERLGAGGLGEVTLATDDDIGRLVAIKRLHDGSDPGTLMRFVDEVQVMGRLDHPNIVPVHDVGCDKDGRLYFVMKRLEGETLEAIIERLRDGDPETIRKYPVSVRVEIMMSILRALQFAHAQRVIHRDLKPSNIMLGKFGEVVVVDWGIAKRLGDPVSAALDVAALPPDELADGASPRRPFRTRVGTLLGTPAYMSPEQARGDNHLLDERSDVFSVCVVFYELLTGHHPFADEPHLVRLLEAIRSQEPAPIITYSSWSGGSVSVELANFVHRGLSKRREDRYATVGEMIEELHAVVDGTFAVTCPVTLMKRSIALASRAIDTYPRTAGMTFILGVLAGVGVLIIRVLHGWS